MEEIGQQESNICQYISSTGKDQQQMKQECACSSILVLN